MKTIDEAIDVVNEVLGYQCKDCGMLTGLEEKCGYCDSLNVGQTDVCDLYFYLKKYAVPNNWTSKMLDALIEHLADEHQDNLWLSKKNDQLMRQTEGAQA